MKLKDKIILALILVIFATATGHTVVRYLLKTGDIIRFDLVSRYGVSSMAGDGLSGGDTTLEVVYGTTANTACEGNDARLPTTDEKAAMTGANSPSSSNVFATMTDVSVADTGKVDTSLINGSFRESFNALVTSNGDSVIMNIEQSGGGDLTMQFSDGQTILDCTPADTMILTIGADDSPQDNFIYVLQSTKALTKSTSDFPTSVEHIKVGYFSVPSAGFVQADGVYINQNWNDVLSGTDNMGHLLHMAERSRRLGAIYHSGMAGNGTNGYLTPTSSNVELKVTAGVIYQMHRHAVSAFDTSTGDTVLVKNWKDDSYHDISNLFDITADSGGNSIGTNKYFNLVIWGVVNKSGEYTPMMINLPSGFYNGQSDAENDVSGKDDFTIPAAYSIHSSTGFLIARITIKMGTTWQVVSTRDLRGTTPSTATGGGAGTPVEFADNTFRIFDESDPDKDIAFQASGITTGNTRTITMPDTNVDLGDIATNTTHKSSDGSDHSLIDQDVTSSSSPTLDGTNFTGIPDGAMDTDYVEVAGDTMIGALIITPTENGTSIVDINQADGTPVFDVDTTNRRVVVSSGTTGQSTIGAGLIVNNDSGSGEINDFQVNSATKTALFVDASADTFLIGLPTLITDKLKFTQPDGNEYIDSLADGYMDYGATTAHRFNANIEIDGNISVDTGAYYHFGDIDGSSGYGFRDNSGAVEYKDSGGGWTAFHASISDDQNLWEEIRTDTGTTTANTTTDTFWIVGEADIGVYSEGDTITIRYEGTAGAGDMLKSTYDPDDDGKIAEAQLKLDIGTIQLWKDIQLLAFRQNNYEYMIDGFNNPFDVEDEGIDTVLSDTYLYNAGSDYYYQEGAGASFTATGGTETSNGDSTVCTFTASGDFTVTGSGNVEILVIAGGGGGSSGGGGAGGLIYRASFAVTEQVYSVTVGGGGDGKTYQTAPGGDNGLDSIFSTLTAVGGGGGGKGDANGILGGSGGGSGAGGSTAGGAGTANQGYAGGYHGGYQAPDYPSGGGGGAYEVGGNATSGSISGNGGDGLEYSISGSAVTYAGGGGGFDANGLGTPGSGGAGGGGAGDGVAGTANTGGGGGGNDSTGTGANGGSGIVIISFIPVAGAGGGDMELYTSQDFTIGIEPVTVQALIFANQTPTSVKLSRTTSGVSMVSASLADTDICNATLKAYLYTADVSGESSDTGIRALIVADTDVIYIYGLSLMGLE